MQKGIKKKLYLVIVAGDASNNTKKLFYDKCNSYSIPIRIIGTKEELGHCIGKSSRAVIAVKDRKFATTLLEHIDQGS